MTTFNKVLFPTDFSKGADHALQQALRLADVKEGEVIVQHVVNSYFEKHPHWTTLFDIHEMQKYMDMYVASEMDNAVPKEMKGDLTFRSVISEGKTALEIAKLAEKELVDVVVMGPARGAVTGSVIRASARPVMTVPGLDDGVEPLRKVSSLLVATDFSEHSKKVVDYAFELKQQFDCEIYMLYVVELTNAIRFGVRQGHFKDAVSKMKKWAEDQLENLTPHQFVSDSSVHWLIEEGSASEHIAACAQAHDVDMIVLGAHGYGPVHQHLVGTTTDKVLLNMERPVMTVKI